MLDRNIASWVRGSRSNRRAFNRPPIQVLRSLFPAGDVDQTSRAEHSTLFTRHGLARPVVVGCCARLVGLAVGPFVLRVRFFRHVIASLVADAGEGGVAPHIWVEAICRLRIQRD